jgi:hypothetical protein
MKKLIILTCIAILAISCNNSKEEKAEERLISAKSAADRENYNEAKLQIDSIKILYPEAFKARKEGQKLLCIVVLKEQRHNLRYLSSMLQTKQQEFEAIKRQYAFEKNAKYQDVGNYFWPTQTVERNLHRSFLRFQVSEQGIMTMTSIYYGSHSIHHRAIKVIAPNGTYTETPKSKDIYESSNLGEKTEKADYHIDQDGGVINFLYLNRNKNIRVIYKGGDSYTTTMSSSDRQALINIYSLTRVLASIQKIKADIEEANVKIKFVLTKQKYDKRISHSTQRQDEDKTN